ncbi:MAG: hypothetical protein ACYC2H_05820 [Thermoplasmatota archaeon]
MKAPPARSTHGAAWPAWAFLLCVLLAAIPSTSANEPEGVGLTVLLFHPDDGVDPLGIPYQGSDPFAVRYGPLVAEKGRFDFPFFIADGVLPIESIPDPLQPFASARSAYDQAIMERLQVQPAVTMTLSSLVAGRQAVVSVALQPGVPLADEDLHVWVAVVEDHVQYQPPPGLTNGITDHRFTVRDVRDLGTPDLAGPVNLTATFLLDDTWQRPELSLAAWVQQDAPSPRFDAREVVQATHAPLGGVQIQALRGVLAEMLSATWCDPCLYGDKAIEDIAVQRGIARPGEAEPSSRYLELVGRDALPIGLAVAAGVALAILARRLP